MSLPQSARRFIIGSIMTMMFSAGFAPTSDAQEIYEKRSASAWGDIFETFFSHRYFGKSYALVIGVGNYTEDWNTLEAPPIDAARIRDFLIHNEGFDFVVTLIDDDATKPNVLRWMEEIFPEKVGPNDRFLFYFSGHGTQRPLKDGFTGYLPLADSGYRTFGNMLAMEDVERWANLLHRARQTLFVLDACFSGLAGRQRKSALPTKTLQRLSQKSNFLITAGTADQESVASLRRWNGSLFTNAFLRGASGRADHGDKDNKPDGIVSLKEIMEYIGKQIDQEAEKIKSVEMHPQMSELSTDNEGEFFFISRDFKNETVGNDLAQDLAFGWPLAMSAQLEDKGAAGDVEAPDPADLAFWNSIAERSNPGYFQAYLKEWPSGRFRSLAALRLEELSAASRRSESEETSSELVAVRRQLEEAQAKMSGREDTIARLRAELAEAIKQRDDLLRSAERTEDALVTEQAISRDALNQVDVLNRQINALRVQLAALEQALDLEQQKVEEREVTIADLGSKLNMALASRVEELSQFRSEFLGRLRQLLGDRPDVQVVGDRFVFQSEVLFPTGSAEIEAGGMEELRKLAESLREISSEIPSDLPWVLQINGHTDRRPIHTSEFPSNWELSTARATAVAKILISEGIPPERLTVAGFAEFHPVDDRRDQIAYRRNRRIELKLTTP